MKHEVFRIIGEITDAFAYLIVPKKGSLRLRFRHGVADMADFFVQPDSRRQGVGTALYREALAMANEHNALSLAFCVSMTNSDAIAFYRRMGANAFYCDGREFWMAHLVNSLGDFAGGQAG